MVISCASLAIGDPGGGYVRGGGIDTFAKMSESRCRACRLVSTMGASGLAGDGFANFLVRSCAAAIAQSAEDMMGIVRVYKNQAMVSEILSALVALIHVL